MKFSIKNFLNKNLILLFLIVVILVIYFFKKSSKTYEYFFNSNNEEIKNNSNTCPCNCTPPIIKTSKCKSSGNNNICPWQCLNYDPTNPKSCVYDEDCASCNPKYNFS